MVDSQDIAQAWNERFVEICMITRRRFCLGPQMPHHDKGSAHKVFSDPLYASRIIHTKLIQWAGQVGGEW